MHPRAKADSDTWVKSEGYKPLLLPLSGEDLLEGRQYALTPLARSIAMELSGKADIPTVVECLYRRVAATEIVSTTTNLETGTVKTQKIVLAAQAATFRYGKDKFELDFALLEARAPAYVAGHGLRGTLSTSLALAEARWFETHEEVPLSRRLRGAPLRWWKQGCPNAKPSTGFRRKAATPKEIDLSILDI